MKYGIQLVPLGKAARDIGMKIRMQPLSSIVVIETKKTGPCGSGWLQIDLRRYHLTVDESFLVFPGPGMDLGANDASAITWVITQLTGDPRSPTMTANGSTISEGWTFRTTPSTEGIYLNTSFSLQAQLDGANFCNPIGYESLPEMTLSLQDAVNVDVSPLDGGVYRWQYNHAFEFSCTVVAENMPSGVATFHYATGGPNTTYIFTFTEVPPDRLQITATFDPGPGPFTDPNIIYIWAEDSLDVNVTAPPWFVSPGTPDWRIIPDDFF